MNRRRVDALERRFAASAAMGCPRCVPMRIYDVRQGPDGEYVQLDGSPLPPLCDCDWGDVPKFILCILPEDQR
jgi:hypothetical protein